MATHMVMLQRMLAASGQEDLELLAQDVLYLRDTYGNNKPERYGSYVTNAGKDVAVVRIGMMQRCFLELQKEDPERLLAFRGSREPARALTARFRRIYGPMGENEPIRDNAEIIPMPEGEMFLTIAEAKEQDLWCDWHEQPFERWAGDGIHSFCRQCQAFMQEWLTPHQWHSLINSWLERQDEEGAAFYRDIVEGWSERESDRFLSRTICAEALIAGITPHEVVGRIRFEPTISSIVTEP